ncbi:MAG: Asp-tRNA(Asn)/Glu-tRNA(Gln) amidotransferase subunit GatC [Alphaproteobacteria bacterium]|nr:Asp-tRNA(Asn)/Glu-tRNA(Gln) amidotransferase subunit GatC [Alphaproteobacteria bacterium]
MSLTPQDIDRIANLARLALQPDEAAQAQTKINGFLKLVEAMQGVDTAGVVPLAHPIEVVQPMALRLRDDVATEPNAREANQRSAPAVERGLFLVPKVIE